MTKWIVRCSITGQIMPESNSKYCDRYDINWARIYGSQAGARTAASSIQSQYDYWAQHDDPSTNENQRKFEVVPVTVEIKMID